MSGNCSAVAAAYIEPVERPVSGCLLTVVKISIWMTAFYGVVGRHSTQSGNSVKYERQLGEVGFLPHCQR